MRRSTLVLVAIVAAGALARAWALGFGLPNIAVRPDEMAIVLVASGLLFNGLNPHFFNWPSLTFYAVAIVYRLSWQVGHWRGLFQHKYEIATAIAANPSPYFMVPRVLSAAAGTLAIWFVYRATRDLIDRTTALVAAFFLAIAFLHVRDSHFGVTDVLTSCFAIAALVPFVAAFRDPLARRPWTVSGILTGLAASTKYVGAVLVVIACAITVVAWHDFGGSETAGARRHLLRRLIRFGVAAGLAFVATTPFSVLAPSEFLAGVQFEQRHFLEGHGMTVGLGWLRHVTFSLWYGLGWPVLIGALAGSIVLARRSWRVALVAGVFPLAYYALMGRGYTVFVRYMIPIVPFLCIPAAVAAVEAVRWLARPAPRLQPLLLIAVAGLMAVPSVTRVIAFDRLLQEPDSRVQAAAWLEAHRQPSDWVAQDSVFVYTELGRPEGLQLARYDAARSAFVSPKDEPVVPEWVLVGTSPLALYTTPPPDLLRKVEIEYTLVQAFVPTTAPEPAAIFDQQDAFYLPFADFSRRIRPGPEVRIYRRR